MVFDLFCLLVVCICLILYSFNKINRTQSLIQILLIFNLNLLITMKNFSHLRTQTLAYTILMCCLFILFNFVNYKCLINFLYLLLVVKMLIFSLNMFKRLLIIIFVIFNFSPYNFQTVNKLKSSLFSLYFL